MPPAALAVPAAAVPEGRRAPGGTCTPCRCGARRGSEPPAALAVPAFSLPSRPLSPQPPSPAGKGETFSLFRRGLPPPAPRALNRLRHLQNLPSRYPVGVCLRRRQFGAKPIESPFYRQCRQPRRGGTGGEELRRLRWSSPPGQIEPVPPGFSPPAGDRAAPRRKKVRRRGANFQIPIDREAKRCYNVSTSAKGFFVVSGNLRHKSGTLPSQREVHGPRPGTRRRGQIF